jgi:hypothetical protein
MIWAIRVNIRKPLSPAPRRPRQRPLLLQKLMRQRSPETLKRHFRRAVNARSIIVKHRL